MDTPRDHRKRYQDDKNRRPRRDNTSPSPGRAGTPRDEREGSGTDKPYRDSGKPRYAGKPGGRNTAYGKDRSGSAQGDERRGGQTGKRWEDRGDGASRGFSDKRSGRPGSSFSKPGGKKFEILDSGWKEKNSDRFRPKTDHETGKPVRLNKYIANAGICSRREADDLITAGLVSINDVTITELGTKVNPGDVVKYNGERLRSDKKVYILLNKPRDVVTTSDDPEGRKTILDLVNYRGKERIFPVGRLDRNTTGVILLTNDGEIAARLTHPKYNQKKIYHVVLDKDIEEEDFKKVVTGLELEDGFIKPDSVQVISPENRKELGIEIHSGRNRIVRRIFEQIGYKVTRLDRVYFAGLTKKNLPKGKWRFLDEREINLLKMNAFR